MVGTYDHNWLVPMAETLSGLGAKRAWVVHGNDGMDELTTTGTSQVAQLADGNISTTEIGPRDAGLPLTNIDSLRGGSPEENAKAIRDLLEGAKGPYRDIVLFNSAAAFVVAEKAANLKEGVELAANTIDSGKAKAALTKLLLIMGKS